MTRTAISLVVLLFAMPALAEPTPEEVARAHYVAAQSYYRQGRVADGLREFQEAYRISPRPAFHYNIAICQEKLGQDQAAIDSYERYLAEVPQADDRAAVEEHVALLRARLPPPLVAPPPPEPAAVSPAPAPAALVAPAAPPPVDKPHRGWIWGVVGGGIALVTVAVIVGAVVGTRGSGDSIHTLPGVTVH